MRRAQLGLGTVVVQAPSLQVSAGGGELFMMSERQGRYYGLGDVGSIIWRLLAEPRSVAEICEALQTEFDVGRATLEADVLGFLGRLAQEGLVEVVASPDLETG